jgi:heat shock protein HslJ
MRRPLVRTGLACLAAGLCACAAATPPPGRTAGAPGYEAAANASYTGIEEQSVALSGGRWQGEPFAPGGAARPILELVRDFWMSGDLDGDGAEEAIVLLVAADGGSGSELYLAALARRKDAVVNSGTVRVGDRVQVRAARVERGRIELDVVQAGPSDALCCPGEKATRAFGFEGEALVELDSRITGRLAPGDLSGVEWLLARLSWDEPAPDEPGVTLVFEGEQASGRSGCNRYVARVRAGDAPGELAIGPIASTRRACPEPEMALEARYLDALGSASKFGFVAGQLALTSQRDGRMETLLFRPRPLAPGTER